MTKRRVANQMMFRNFSSGLKFPVKIVNALSGTGTVAEKGILTVVLASGAVMSSSARIYLTCSSGTNIGTLVGTA